VYLKSLEMLGFKSFAGKTKLAFEPGMTAVVGPNGCGKSNIADAIRWVLGEQSAKALRGGKMQDVIFSGTDTAKPMGMAEVSLTLAECEEALGMDFHEVTVTRRVLGSGEGQYFINKAPCRLKDIQRLFMDTGIGTNSYSMMEQGRIDRILSSRPEDRRSVFEEASGITKYKADKKEALRKLDHTEANLLRLDDIIREVRRQIISLQRQAGKARRYQEMQGRLRGLDIYYTRQRLRELDGDIRRLETGLSALRERAEAAREDVRALDEQTTAAREDEARREQAIAQLLEAVAEARSKVAQCRERMRVNEDRVAELQVLAQRDTRDAEEARSRLAQHGESLARLEAQGKTAEQERDAAKAEFDTHGRRLAELQQHTDEAGGQLHALRTELVDLESRAAKLQNELSDLEAAERTTVVRRERLAAEQAELQRACDQFSRRRETMTRHREALRQTRDEREAAVAALRREQEGLASHLRTLRQEHGDLRSELAARQARVQMLEQSVSQAEGFPGGARMLLEGDAALGDLRETILGSLAEHIHTAEPYRTALQAVLRVWLDAVVVRDESAATELASLLRGRQAGSARLLSTRTAAAPAARSEPADAPRLLDHVTFSEHLRPVLERLLWNVFMVDRLEDLPANPAWDHTYVTREGDIRRGDGSTEVWMPDAGESNPLARQQQLSTWQDDARSLEGRLQDALARQQHLQTREEELAARLEVSRLELQEAEHALAVCEGESRMVETEARQAADRLDTVTFEREALQAQESSGVSRRGEITDALAQVRTRQDEARRTIAAQTDALRTLEQERAAVAAAVTEHRVRYAERRQTVEHLDSQRASLQSRIEELEALVRERSAGINTYTARITELTAAAEEARTRVAPLQEACQAREVELEQVRAARAAMAETIRSLDHHLREKRTYLEEILAERSAHDVELAEQRLRRQTAVERVAGDYHITLEEVLNHPDPEWEGDAPPDADTLETTIGELRAKLEAMGPVNLVAIEEHQELEERYAFLTDPATGRPRPRQTAVDGHDPTINRTTTELFRTPSTR
jgi:chromosome segregation protein